ncbi:hypothetical protein AMECASPLE_034985 [Ameca splendens]|uniref:Uncharacterized protein n=1 Tax=Ameca splendens TaxID=208324 RepID=A0ABV0ZSU5_9TELE
MKHKLIDSTHLNFTLQSISFPLDFKQRTQRQHGTQCLHHIQMFNHNHTKTNQNTSMFFIDNELYSLKSTTYLKQQNRLTLQTCQADGKKKKMNHNKRICWCCCKGIECISDILDRMKNNQCR